MNAPKKYTLPKHEIIRSDKVIQELFKEGNKMSGKNLILYYLTKKKSDSVQIQVFFHVRKKDWKKATNRNKIKRILREVHRLNKHEWLKKIGQDYSILMVLSYKQKTLPVFDEIKKDYLFFIENSIKGG